MNSYLVVSTDDRSYLDLKNIVVELKKRKLPYFFLYSNSPERLPPASNLDNFSYDTNVEYTSRTFSSRSLGFELPFNPSVLLITNENWEPEKSILWEFKQKGAFIGCIENSSWILNNIKSKLEILSRKTFPSNCIDLFFDHSNWALESKVASSWWKEKSRVVGNPKFDDLTVPSIEEEKIIMVYGSMEIEHHANLLDIYRNIKSKLPGWKVLYKPHPSELKDFKIDFEDIETIQTYDEYLTTLPKTPFHVGIFSTVMLYPLLYNKKVVYLDNESSGMSKELDLNNFKGHEFNFWQKVLGFLNFKEFEDTIGNTFLEKIKYNNNLILEDIKLNLIFYDKNCTFIDKTSNNKQVLKYFDEFNDGKASQRIINFIESE